MSLDFEICVKIRKEYIVHELGNHKMAGIGSLHFLLHQMIMSEEKVACQAAKGSRVVDFKVRQGHRFQDVVVRKGFRKCFHIRCIERP